MTAETTNCCWIKRWKKIGYTNFVNEIQPKLRAEGKHVGIGIVAYVGCTGIGPYEGAKVRRCK